MERCKTCDATGFVHNDPNAEHIAHDYYNPSEFCPVCQGKGMHPVGLGDALGAGTLLAAPLPEPRARRSSITAEQHLVSMQGLELNPDGQVGATQDDWGVMTNPDAPVGFDHLLRPDDAASSSSSSSGSSDGQIKIADSPGPQVGVVPDSGNDPNASMFGAMFSTTTSEQPDTTSGSMSPEPPVTSDASADPAIQHAMSRGFKLGAVVSLTEFQEDIPDMNWDEEILCPGETGTVVQDEESGTWCILDEAGLLWVNIEGPSVRGGVKRPPDAQLADFYCADDLILAGAAAGGTDLLSMAQNMFG